jgi:hypothetical protein
MRRRFAWIQGRAPAFGLKLLVSNSGSFYIAGDRDTPLLIASEPGGTLFEVNGLTNSGPGLNDWAAGGYNDDLFAGDLSVIFYDATGLISTYDYSSPAGFSYHVGGNFASISVADTTRVWATAAEDVSIAADGAGVAYVLPGVTAPRQGTSIGLSVLAALDPSLSHALVRGEPGENWKIYLADGSNFDLSLAINANEVSFLSLVWPRIYRVPFSLFFGFPAAGLVTLSGVEEYLIEGSTATLQRTFEINYISPGPEYGLFDARVWL